MLILVAVSVQILIKSDLIGTAENIPCESERKPHIHLEIQKDGNYVNPDNYLNKKA